MAYNTTHKYGQNTHNSQKGKRSEDIICNYYIGQGYTLIRQNYRFPGGEIDIIMSNDTRILFIEVKSFWGERDIAEYISHKKKQRIRRAIYYYMWKENIQGWPRVDIAFVKNNKIFDIFEDIAI